MSDTTAPESTGQQPAHSWAKALLWRAALGAAYAAGAAAATLAVQWAADALL